MKLLFDENLSPDLPRLVAIVFPGSVHVRELGLVGADDEAIWTAAATNGFILVTKDDDFLEMSVLRGAPPKIVTIGLGNCRTANVATLLVAKAEQLHKFWNDTEASVLELP